jgi:hypothetical protein
MRRRPPTTAVIAVLAVFFAAGAARAADAAPPVFEGTWIATAGTAVFHGKWSAQALPGARDDMQGSWSVLNDAGDVTAKGTWSARRSRRGFQGKWSARAASGAIFTGTFEAHLPGFKGEALEDMFAETKTKQIAGFWQMGRDTRGNWYLKGPAPPP